MIVDQVQWFRDRAQMQRWVEEFEIVEEEFRRTIRSYARMAEIWTSLAESPGLAKGFTPYALKQAQMYQDMSEDCEQKFTAANGTWPNGCSLSEHISRRCRERIP
jgi:hypothetical protein